MKAPTASIFGLAMLAATSLPAALPAAADPMVMDNPTSMNGLDTVCTGIGSAKDDPRWSGYPIRIEFANAGAQYLSGAHVTLSQRGRTLADFDCAGAWVLVKGKQGKYHVGATIADSPTKPASAAFVMRSGSQKRVVLRFSDLQANR